MKNIVFWLFLLLFTCMGCHPKEKNNKKDDATVIVACKDTVGNDTIPIYNYSFINRIKPLPTMTKIVKMENGKEIQRNIDNIQVNFLLGESNIKAGALRTEIFNYTEDDIFYVKSWFNYYNGKEWILLSIPEGHSILDIGMYIPSAQKSGFYFFIPPIDDFGNGKYRLQLIFTNADKTHTYDVVKEFRIESG